MNLQNVALRTQCINAALQTAVPPSAALPVDDLAYMIDPVEEPKQDLLNDVGLAAQAARARAAGVTPSEWYAVSQASDAERELLLAIAEAPRTSGGVSSSGA